MRALFVGGTVDNSELDLAGDAPPQHYPPDTGSGTQRYWLHQLGRSDGAVAYAVYAAPDLADEEIERIVRVQRLPNPTPPEPSTRRHPPDPNAPHARG
jgi:hypothetical protein